MLRRPLAIASLCAAIAACDRSDLPAAPAHIEGLGDVRVLDARYVASPDTSSALGGGATGWIVARVELTNDFGVDATPQIGRFTLVARDGTRSAAHDDGSVIFTGVSNSTDVLKRDARRTYTIGFRATDTAAVGQIVYDH